MIVVKLYGIESVKGRVSGSRVLGVVVAPRC
jgi:hypothetical protein